MSFSFEKNGYLGTIITPRGKINTPNFIFCATKGALKGMLPNMLGDQEIILSNTFHLMKHAKYINEMGGLHRCMGWNKPILTDSGGFQVFSLGYGSIANEIKGIRKGENLILNINEEGCTFKDYKNGDRLFLSPEKSLEIQYLLGVDFMVTFDECTPAHSSYEYNKKSLMRTNRWQDRFLEAARGLNMDKRRIYGIIQGGIHKDLRDISINYVKSRKDFFAYAIGGSLGKTKAEMYDIVKYTSNKLGRDKPIHLLGIGNINDILELAPYVDTFDCVDPTRIARHGIALIPGGRKNLNNSKYIGSSEPLYHRCLCYTCQHTTQGFIRQLLRDKEIAGLQYLLIHNTFTMRQLMKDIKNTINNSEQWLETKKYWHNPIIDL